MIEDENPLETISHLREWKEELFRLTGVEDEILDECLELCIKIVAKPNIPQQKVAVTMVKLSALNMKFRANFALYMGFMKGTDNATHIKNLYKAIYDGIDRLVDTMKYLVKA